MHTEHRHLQTAPLQLPQTEQDCLHQKEVNQLLTWGAAFGGQCPLGPGAPWGKGTQDKGCPRGSRLLPSQEGSSDFVCLITLKKLQENHKGLRGVSGVPLG